MKQSITTAYVFTPAARTVDLSSISGFSLNKLYAIINVTANQIIYATGTSYGLNSIVGAVLTLQYNTTAMNSTDTLTILYDVDSSQVSVSSSTLPTNAAQESGGHLASIDTKLNDDGSGNLKVTLSGGTISVGTASDGTIGSAIPSQANLGGAKDASGNMQPLRVNASGELLVAADITVDSITANENLSQVAGNTVNTGIGASGSGTQRVAVSSDSSLSVSSSALPLGASTSALQTTGNTSLSTIATQTSNLPAALGQTTMSASLPVAIASDQSSIPVTVAAVPDITSTGSLAALNAAVTINTNGLTTVGIDISGTWTGVITPEGQINGVWYPLQFVDTGGGLLGLTFSANNMAQINSAGLVQVRARMTTFSSGSATVKLNGSIAGGLVSLSESLPQGGNTIGNVNVNGTVPVSAASLPLPSGAATSANQATEIASLSSIDTKTPALGQALAAASTPVVLTAAQMTTLTPLSSVTVTQATGTNLHTVVDSSALPTGAATSANQTNASQKTQVVDGSGNVITSTTRAGKQGLDVTLGSSAVPGSAAPNWTDIFGGVDGSGNAQQLQVDASKNLKVSIQNASVAVTATQLPAALGSQASSTAMATVLPNDQTGIPVTTSPSIVVATPTTNSMAALSATVVYQVQASGSYYFTLTNSAAATTAWVGTVTFQYSTNGGSTYNSLAVSPIASPANSANTSTATANGLFLAEIPAGVGSQIVYIRANMTAYTSGTAQFFVSPQQQNQKIIMPWAYSVTSGQTILGPVEASGISELAVQISAVTTTVLTMQGTNDPSLTTWATIPVIQTGALAASVATLSAAATYRGMPNGYKWIRLQVTTTGTVLTIQGIVATLGQQLVITSIGNDIGVTVNAGTLPTVTTVGTVSNITTGTIATVTNSQSAKPVSITDVASAAITTTTTTATLTPTYGNAYQVNIPVTAATGTTPTMDVQIQESRDGGTNWVPVYDFPRITATGSYNSPMLPFTGTSVRYVQTISGTTPSFTRAINRLQSSAVPKFLRQMIDRTITLTTLSSTTAVLALEQQTSNVQLVINIGAVTTTAPAIQLQMSDDAGVSWYSIGSPLTGVASSTVSVTITNMAGQQIRGIVTTAGVGVTAGYVLIRGF